MWIIEPPSQGRIRNPLGSISALTKLEAGGPGGPPVAAFKDLSQIYIKQKTINKFLHFKEIAQAGAKSVVQK